MADNRLLELIGEDGIAVCDGAMGTMLYARGVFINRSFEELNLSRPELVRSVHAEYLRAGADIIETNTFGANRYKLASHGLEERVREVNLAGVRVAREAVQGRALVAGAVGPLGIRIEPWGPTSREEVQAAYREQMAALIEGGVDLVILETFHHLPELREAVIALRALADLPLIAQVAITDEVTTPEGVPAAEAARAMAEWDTDAIGVNCGVGPLLALEAIEEMRLATDKPLAAQPNAGLPRSVNGRNMYLTSPEFLASYARRFVKAGVRVVGGCCGTTPEHIRAIREAVSALRPAPIRARSVPPVSPGQKPSPKAAGSVALHEASRLARNLQERRPVLMVQVSAPRGTDASVSLEHVRALREGGVDCIFVPESLGGGHMAPLAFACLCELETGVETLPEYSCRGRALLGMQSDMLGAHALGLRNVLLTTGAPTALGEHPDATTGFDVDAIGLTHMVRRLNESFDVAGNVLGSPTSFLLGVRLDPLSVDLAHEIRRFEWKVEAGARFALTTVLDDPAPLEELLPRIAHCRIPVIASVMVGAPAARSAGSPAAEMDTAAPGLDPAQAKRLAEQLGKLVEGIRIVPAPVRPTATHGASEGLPIMLKLLEDLRKTC